MGCDGGSIPRREELVKTKKKPEKPNPNELERIKWFYCAISKEPLKEPIVTCDLGYLYNKEAVIKQLLEKSLEGPFRHIRSLKDLIPVRFTHNPAFAEKNHDLEGCNSSHSPFICPITLLEVGHYRFSVIRECGCVLSERALRELPSSTCIQCGTPFVETDIIPLNGTASEVEELRKRMDERRANEKKDKKGKEKGKGNNEMSKVQQNGKAQNKEGGLGKEKVHERANGSKKRSGETISAAPEMTPTAPACRSPPVSPTELNSKALKTGASASVSSLSATRSEAYASIFTSSLKKNGEGDRRQETFTCRNVLRT